MEEKKLNPPWSIFDSFFLPFSCLFIHPPSIPSPFRAWTTFWNPKIGFYLPKSWETGTDFWVRIFTFPYPDIGSLPPFSRFSSFLAPSRSSVGFGPKRCRWRGRLGRDPEVDVMESLISSHLGCCQSKAGLMDVN